MILQTLADEKFNSGRSAYLRQNYEDTVTDISRALSLWPDHPEAADYSFYLGSAALETRKYDVAVEHLQRFVADAKGRRNKDYGYLLLARGYEAKGENDKAE